MIEQQSPEMGHLFYKIHENLHCWAHCKIIKTYPNIGKIQMQLIFSSLIF